jgi:hypothetical protein
LNATASGDVEGNADSLHSLRFGRDDNFVWP